MTATLLANIDDVRERIQRLEADPIFSVDAWAKVLADLTAMDRPAALADAVRRMETARANARMVGMLDNTVLYPVLLAAPVAMETEA